MSIIEEAAAPGFWQKVNIDLGYGFIDGKRTTTLCIGLQMGDGDTVIMDEAEAREFARRLIAAADAFHEMTE